MLMVPTLRTRKPIDELTVLDIETFPVWEFAIAEEGAEGQDETWVRPLKVKRVPRRGYSFQVAADFTTPGGVQLVGIANVTTAGKIEIDTAVILSGGRYIFIPDRSQSRPWKSLSEALGLTAAKSAPLSYTLRVPIEGRKGMRSGVIK
jgi:hypothetical protein